MKKIISIDRYNNPQPSVIAVGDTLEMFGELTADKKTIIITDANLYCLYGAIIDRYPHIIIPTGEEHKTIETIGFIGRRLLEMGADRSSYLVGMGGGIVTDITGFVASTYMRGVGFGFVASSLLAQVDASVGGKNGVNLNGYKNIIGTFNQPDFVLCDLDMLKTLPRRELRAGMSEMIKCGLIRDSSLFDVFEREGYDGIMADRELLGKAIVAAVEIKASVVEADEKEAGERKLLNLGHTFGHAIEKSTSKYIHGEAVAIGIVIAARISVREGMLAESEYQRIVRAIRGLGLPTEAEGVDRKTLIRAAHSDKKKSGDCIEMILLEGIGRGVICKLPVEKFDSLL